MGQFVYETSMPMIAVTGYGSDALPIGSIAFFENITSIDVGDTVLSERNNQITFSLNPISEKQKKIILNKENRIKVYGRCFFVIPLIGYVTLFINNYIVGKLILAFGVAFAGCGILGHTITKIHSKLWSFILAIITLCLYIWIYVALIIKFSSNIEV